MKAILQDKYGGPEVLKLQEITEPTPGPDQVLIKVHASTVNRTDCAILRAQPFIMRFFNGFMKPRNEVPGTDFSGEIVAVGKQVKSYKVGDKVFGFSDAGLQSKAETMVLEEGADFIKMPRILSYEAAAAIPEGVHYAYNFINKVELNIGDKVLVNGATGAIGSALVQLLKSLEIEVTAVGNTKNKELLMEIGADAFIDYTREDFTQIPGNFDYVFDAVGKSTFSKCKAILKKSGVYISSELGPKIQNPFLSLLTPLFGGKQVKFPFPSDVKRSLNFVVPLFEDEKYLPVIDRTYPLEECAEAYRYVERGEKTGNVVIKIGT